MGNVPASAVVLQDGPRLASAATGAARQRRASHAIGGQATPEAVGARAENQTGTDCRCLFYLFPHRLSLVVIWNEPPHEGCGKPYRQQHGSNAARTAKRRLVAALHTGKGPGGYILPNEANGFSVLGDADHQGRHMVTADRIPKNGLASFGFVRGLLACVEGGLWVI